IREDPRRAVHTLGVGVEPADLAQQVLVTSRPRRELGALARGPLVVPRAGHPEELTHPHDLVFGLLRVDQLERPLWLFEAFSVTKKAAAFFRNSRSMRSWAFSVRSRSSSARSSTSS